jgi:uncharacterized protein
MSEQEAVVWVGGRQRFAASIAGMSTSESLLTLWVELPSLLVVGQLLEDPSAPETSFVESLERASAAPFAGPARRPTHVRVASEELAEPLRALSWLTVEVLPTPELDTVVRSLDAYVGKGSYFSDPLLTRAELTDFFAAAAALWQPQPWQYAEDNALVYFENEALGISDSAISISGADDDVPGVVLYPSFEDFEQMRDVLAGEADSERGLSHSALYLLFASAETIAPAMREEVEAEAFVLPAPGRYPILRRLRDGKPAPVLVNDVRVATVMARALARFVTLHRDALEQYGELPVRERLVDNAGSTSELTVPHPEVDLAEFEDAPRADTLEGGDNPYQLPLSDAELRQLGAALNKLGLHRLLGILVGVASVPQQLPPSRWMALLKPPKSAGEAELKAAVALMTTLHNHVLERMAEWDIEGLVPVAEDAVACREWARGYAAVCDEVELGEQTGEAIDTLFALYVLAEQPVYLKLLDEHRGSVSRDERIDEYRDLLADAASFLFDHWQPARAALAQKAATKPAPQRAEPKVGRNDPCPCGSGKKYKKCHG